MKQILSLSELIDMDKSFRTEMETIAQNNGLCTNDCKPITDGLYCPEAYYNSKLKVLVILYEAYDDIEDGVTKGDGYPNTCFLENMQNGEKISNTYRRMIYFLNGLYYGTSFKDMADAKEIININSRQYRPTLERCMHINMSKMPALTRTKDRARVKRVYEAYWAELTARQIKAFSPNLVICGGDITFEALSDIMTDLKNEKILTQYVDNQLLSPIIKPDNRSVVNGYYAPESECIVLHAWHPNYYGCKGLTDETYTESIRKTAEFLIQKYRPDLLEEEKRA